MEWDGPRLELDIMGSILGLCVSEVAVTEKPTAKPDQIMIDKRDGLTGEVIWYAVVKNPHTVEEFEMAGISESDLIEFARGAIVIKLRAKYWPSATVKNPVRSALASTEQRRAYDNLSDANREKFDKKFYQMAAEINIS